MIPISRRALLGAAPLLLAPRLAWAAAPTPAQTEGPFYPAELPSDEDSDLVKIEGAVREAGGEILHLGGRAADPDGRPLAGLRIEIWQCDANGVYLDQRNQGGRDAAFQGFGHAVTDAAGAFAFRTIVPVPYPGRTPHIHVKVLRDGRELRTTQLYRAGFAQNESDGQYRRLSPAERAALSMTLTPTLTPRADEARPAYATEVRLVLVA